MPRFLALEWNDTEARLAVAGTHGDRYEVEQAFSISLGPGSTGETAEPPDAGERIAAALAARGLGRLETLVAIGRTNIELRNLSFPPVPDAELPEMVRFQAMREFNALDESWPLDFLPINDEPDQPRSVLAAAVDSDLVGQIQETCRGAGLKPRRLVLRPCAAASLLCRTGGDALRPVTLLVDLLVDEADLTVVSDGKVIYLRTARLPGDPLVDAPSSLALLSEIRRTTAAAQNQLRGRAVESIVLCGSGKTHSELAGVIRRKFETPTELFDPFAGLSLSPELVRALPDHPGRFAPLLGALVDELEQAPAAIDFLHPRRPPRPPSRRNTYAAVGLVAASLLGTLLIGGMIYGSRLAKETEQLNRQSKALDTQLERAMAVKSAASDVKDWKANDFNWLEQLRWLSQSFPPAKEAMLTELQMMSRDGSDLGVISVAGLAEDIEAIRQGEENLRDDRHRVIGNRATEEDSTTRYAWRFSSSVITEKEGP